MAETMPGLAAALDRMPLVAILRGIRPDEAVAVAMGLVDAGIAVIEVPLNSPNACDSIARIVESVGDHALVGAGTVLTPAQVGEVKAAGGRLIVMPHSDPAVIGAGVAAGIPVVPGVLTPTEAFAALANGAAALKLFPGEMVPPAIVRALLAVLPKGTTLVPTGGVDADSLAEYWRAGARGFGIGSALYKPGKTAESVAADARVLVAAMNAAR